MLCAWRHSFYLRQLNGVGCLSVCVVIVIIIIIIIIMSVNSASGRQNCLIVLPSCKEGTNETSFRL